MNAYAKAAGRYESRTPEDGDEREARRLRVLAKRAEALGVAIEDVLPPVCDQETDWHGPGVDPWDEGVEG